MVGAVLLEPRGGRAVAGFALAVVLPPALTALALLPTSKGTAVPACLYLLGVAAASVLGGLWPGLLAAALSFAGLDYFFTPPRHTFAVSKGEDLFVLAVFMIVAGAVSATLAALVAQRARAELREYQVRTLAAVMARLLSGEPLETVLLDLATALRTLFQLEGCRVVMGSGEGEQVVGGAGSLATDALSPPAAAHVTAVPLRVDGRPLGRIEMAGTPRGMGPSERQLVETFAGQLALAAERTRLGKEAEASRLEAEASRIRAALFSSVTHDLRTPLASITASASSLLEAGVPFTDEQRAELLRTILEESVRLNRLVANLMDISRLRAGALVPTVEQVPFEDLVSSVVDRLRPMLVGRPLRVQVREDLPAVPMDVVQMDQALTNLLENAARYSLPGTEIGVAVSRWQDGLEVRVSDRGPGIPKGEREQVFREFYRRDVGERRGGTGLGLAIAQAVVAAHGGTVWIEDTPGGGTTVGIRLPLHRVERTPAGLP